MLRQNPARTDLNRGDLETSNAPDQGVDIQEALNALEEYILDSARIPLTGKTLVDEEEVLDQLDLIRMSLPDAFERAQAIIAQKETILAEAEDYARQIATMAEQRAAQILEETGIIQQAQREAQQIRQQLQQECETLQRQTLQEVDQLRSQSLQEIEETRRQALLEQRQIQEDADHYADSLLGDLEQRLGEMLRVVKNGRQQVHRPSGVGLESGPQPSLPKVKSKGSGKSSGSQRNRHR